MAVLEVVPARRLRQAVREVQQPQLGRVPAEPQQEPRRESARAEALEPVPEPEPERAVELPRRPGLQQP